MKFLLLGVTLIIFGCATVLPPKEFKAYDGDILSQDKVASVAVDANVKGVKVYAINGKEIPRVINGQLMPNWKGAHVLPGKHILYLTGNFKMLGNYSTSQSDILEIDVKAGHSYIPYFEKTPTGETIFKVIDAGENYDQNCLIGFYPDHTNERKNAKNCI